ncbi:MAG: hypothetical protein M9953_03775 [Thermomicrobiales bacterium]|nr:hypothetical protein [Thermomicrobiales bacterium]
MASSSIQRGTRGPPVDGRHQLPPIDESLPAAAASVVPSSAGWVASRMWFLSSMKNAPPASVSTQFIDDDLAVTATLPVMAVILAID